LSNSENALVNTSVVDLESVVRDNYMIYAKSVIIARAFPFIDGLKPVQRRILYSMLELKCDYRKYKKCARIVGDTMGKYHPHGDSSIYGALCNMSDVNETMNCALSAGSGSLGKSWSDSALPKADMRYTEASLTRLAENELFRGLNENAVDMVPNYDLSEKEPELLPVSFPSILCNVSSGIGVGISTNIPTYALGNVCDFTTYVLKNLNSTDWDIEKLVDILGAPDFITGGTVNISKKQLKSLMENGECSGIYLTGSYVVSNGSIMIKAIPSTTTVEKVFESIKDRIESGQINGVKEVKNLTGENGLGIKITLKRGFEPEKVMQEVKVYTPFRDSISYYTKFIWKEENGSLNYKEPGIFKLIKDYWIPWRMDCIRRQYIFKRDRVAERVHELRVWEIIKDSIEEVVNTMRSNTEAVGKELLKVQYGIDDIQVSYLYRARLSSITTDNAKSNLEKLVLTIEEMKEYELIASSDDLIKNIIAEDLARVKSKYAKGDRVTNVTSVEVVASDKEAVTPELYDEVIEKGMALVNITENGYMKRTMNANDLNLIDGWAGDNKIKYSLQCDNTDMLVVFTTSGYCYKIPVYRIDNSRGKYEDMIWKLVEKDSDDGGEIAYITTTSDYSESITVIYVNGMAIKVGFETIKLRTKYKRLYEPFRPGVTGVIFNHDKFFAITSRGDAAYVDTTYYEKGRRNRVFELPKTKKNDNYAKFVPANGLKDLDKIDVGYFTKRYTVGMKEYRNYILG